MDYRRPVGWKISYAISRCIYRVGRLCTTFLPETKNKTLEEIADDDEPSADINIPWTDYEYAGIYNQYITESNLPLSAHCTVIIVN